ncbi:hypothetical protein OJ998_17715 [Solirubrobacter taibaiensis]|nr:hypothetical protein [Solirubrobacter taibaiensis]
MRPTSLLLLATLGLVGLLARPAAAADWSVQPAANQFGDGREDFRYTLNPGGEAEDAIVVTNQGTAPLKVALRADLPWMKLDADALTVAPGESAEVPFTITLPGDATSGDHAGAVAATGGGITATLPIRLRVGGPLTPQLTVEDVQVSDARVTYVLHNTGNAILGAHQQVKLTGPFGRFAATVDAVPDATAVLPGERRTVSAPVRDVTPAVRLSASVTLTPLLTDAAGSTAPLAPTVATGHAWAIPWLLLLVLVVTVVLAAVATRVVRRSNTALTRVSGPG